jgi:hypothetical protein
MAGADVCKIVVLVHNMDGEGFSALMVWRILCVLSEELTEEDLGKLIKTGEDDERQQKKKPVITVKLLSEGLQMARNVAVLLVETLEGLLLCDLFNGTCLWRECVSAPALAHAGLLMPSAERLAAESEPAGCCKLLFDSVIRPWPTYCSGQQAQFCG